jgi:hypothetical protein
VLIVVDVVKRRGERGEGRGGEEMINTRMNTIP